MQVYVNQGRFERVLRVVLGIVLLVASIGLVKSWLRFPLGLVGVVLLYSGAIGFCHVRQFLGFESCKREPSDESRRAS